MCNIGTAEIGRRRRAGHLALAATAVLLAGLLAIDAPRIARLLVALPAASAAVGYLQARLRFCAGFAARGNYNFGPAGQLERIEDARARALDRAQAMRIWIKSAAIGAVVGVAAALLPI